jgi:hypothetical protein
VAATVQPAFAFENRALPPVGALEIALLPQLAVTVTNPSLWPGHALALVTGDPNLIPDVGEWFAAHLFGDQSVDVITIDGNGFADEDAAFVALSHAERGLGRVLVLSPTPVTHLDIALPDLRSRLLGIGELCLPEASLNALEALLKAYCTTLGLRVEARDCEHAAALLPARLSAVRSAVSALNQSIGLSTKVDRQALLAACSAVATQTGEPAP